MIIPFIKDEFNNNKSELIVKAALLLSFVVMATSGLYFALVVSFIPLSVFGLITYRDYERFRRRRD